MTKKMAKYRLSRKKSNKKHKSMTAGDALDILYVGGHEYDPVSLIDNDGNIIRSSQFPEWIVQYFEIPSTPEDIVVISGRDICADKIRIEYYGEGRKCVVGTLADMAIDRKAKVKKHIKKKSQKEILLSIADRFGLTACELCGDYYANPEYDCNCFMNRV